MNHFFWGGDLLQEPYSRLHAMVDGHQNSQPRLGFSLNRGKTTVDASMALSSGTCVPHETFKRLISGIGAMKNPLNL